ncbi:MAG: NAD-dependent epimerase/dehydratase family protein [Candidatus Baltobacteraceae bacterium]|jgi:nucleoside-diphosphate-sugar epimerase
MSRITSRTALVTGCAGFIGSHVVEHLLASGFRVHGIDSFDDYYDPRLKVKNIEGVLHDERFVLDVMDLAAPGAARVLSARARPDVVIHLAGMPGVRRSIEEPGRYVRANVVATQNVLDAFAQKNAVPIVFAGSSSAYGNDTPAPFDESAPCARPASPYAATKRACELLCSVAGDTLGAPITVVRLFTVYGPRQRPDLAIRKFATAMLRGEEIVVYGDGSMARDYTHVSDVVRGIAAAAEEREGFRIINLGNSSPVNLLDLIEKLGRALEIVPRLRFVERPPGELNVTYADITRATERWSWRPRVTLEQGLADFAVWLRSELQPAPKRARRVKARRRPAWGLVRGLKPSTT